jgi:hypothetical protein
MVGISSRGGGFAELVAQDATPWYSKPNLAHLYLFFVLAAMDVVWISGFDGSIIYGLQAIESSDECKSAVTSS